MTSNETVVGIDVSQTHLDVVVLPLNQKERVGYDDAQVAGLIERLKTLSPIRVVLEATGGIETPLAAALGAAGLPVAVVNPRQVRDYARAIGRLAKTDTIDAEVIALFAQAIQPQVRPLPDDDSRRLEALITRRRQLVQMIIAEKNRLTTVHPAFRSDIQAHIRWMEKRLGKLDD
jgi:transposase